MKADNEKIGYICLLRRSSTRRWRHTWWRVSLVAERITLITSFFRSCIHLIAFHLLSSLFPYHGSINDDGDHCNNRILSAFLRAYWILFQCIDIDNQLPATNDHIKKILFDFFSFLLRPFSKRKIDCVRNLCHCFYFHFRLMMTGLVKSMNRVTSGRSNRFEPGKWCNELDPRDVERWATLSSAVWCQKQRKKIVQRVGKY